MHLLPLQSAASQGACLDSLLFRCFQFKLTFESLKQLGVCHHSPILGEAITFPLIILFVISHGDCIQMSFSPGLPSRKS
jgi:hypothetical protein